MMARLWLIPLSLFSMTLHADAFVVSEGVYATISEAQRLLQKNAPRRALDVLVPVLDNGRPSEYERTLLRRLAGAAAMSAGDYSMATVHFERALAGGFLSARVSEQLRYRLARLYVHDGRYGDALSLLAQWIDAAVCPQARLCFLVASIYASSERWPVALEWAERGLRQSDSSSERQYALVVDLNLAAKNITRAIELLNLLVNEYSDNARYWRQLSMAHAELGRDDHAIAVAELGYLRGVLSSAADVDRLAVLYLQADVPGKAARLLEAVSRRWPQTADAYRYRLLGKAWFAAREYQRALTALDKASVYPRSDDPRQVADGCLLRGIAYMRLSRYEEARQAFAYCLRFDAVRDSAGRWIGYLQR